jgi:hypothetical protein
MTQASPVPTALLADSIPAAQATGVVADLDSPIDTGVRWA